jgi:hypothetical protein
MAADARTGVSLCVCGAMTATMLSPTAPSPFQNCLALLSAAPDAAQRLDRSRLCRARGAARCVRRKTYGGES